MFDSELFDDGIYKGSPLANPRAEKIGEFSALLSQQPAEFQKIISELHAGLRLRNPVCMPVPPGVTLTMSQGTIIQSDIVNETISYSPKTGTLHLMLGKWDGSRYTRALIDITGDNMSVVVHNNPPEAANEWRKPNPTIVPCDPTTTSDD